jgi:hypothetical protein
LSRHSFIIRPAFLCAALLLVAACKSATQSSTVAPAAAATGDVTAAAAATETSMSDSTPAEVQDEEQSAATSSEVVTSATTTEGSMTESEAAAGATVSEAADEPGTSAPPAAASGDTESEAPAEDAQTVSDLASVHTDSTYGFRVNHPADYQIRAETAANMAALEPQPVAAYVFMNPATAASDIAELELPDLQLRVYPVGEAASLEEWLASQGFLAAGNLPPEPFQAGSVAGLEVCLSTMIVPNCSYFVFGEDWVYQLVPGSAAGEAMMATFALVP